MNAMDVACSTTIVYRWFDAAFPACAKMVNGGCTTVHPRALDLALRSKLPFGYAMQGLPCPSQRLRRCVAHSCRFHEHLGDPAVRPYMWGCWLRLKPTLQVS